MIPSETLIFGAGLHAQKLAKAYEEHGTRVIAYVVSKKNSRDNLNGTPISTWEDVRPHIDKDAPLSCGVFNHRDSYDGLAGIFADNGVNNVLWPWDYYPKLAESMGWCYWLDPNPKSLDEWKSEAAYQQLLSKLSDEESRSTLTRTLAFRSGNDIAFSSFKSSDSHYFNRLTLPNVPLDKPLCYIDLGAYSGDTLQELCRKTPVGTAILLEPDPANFHALTQNLKSLTKQYPTLTPYALPLGAGSDYGTFFLSGEKDAVNITTSKPTDDTKDLRAVSVVPLGDLLPATVADFIKIDVEGHDLAALQGMRELLQRSKPTLAVSLYHRPHDIVTLSLELAEMLDGTPYNYYIRQHLNNSFESVLYAVPRDSQ
jgi:FkbM family methyltransferase